MVRFVQCAGVRFFAHLACAFCCTLVLLIGCCAFALAWVICFARLLQIGNMIGREQLSLGCVCFAFLADLDVSDPDFEQFGLSLAGNSFVCFVCMHPSAQLAYPWVDLLEAAAGNALPVRAGHRNSQPAGLHRHAKSVCGRLCGGQWLEPAFLLAM